MLVIRNGRVLDPETGLDKVLDLAMEDGKIVKMGENLDFEGAEVLDAEGLVVAPGLVDGHVHFRDPGQEWKEDIETGARAAARGGVTTVICMANTVPRVDNLDTLNYVLEKGKKTGIHVLQAGAITEELKGEKLTDMEALVKAGATGLTDDGIPLLSEELVRAAMEKAKELDVVLSFHEENPAFITNNGINRGKISEHFGIGGSPREAEDSLVERDCKLALETGAKINIQHISSAGSVDLVRQAKAAGANVYAEAAPHHFTLTEDAVLKHGTLAKMNPPLRTEADRLAVIEGLQDGTIDMIVTDHAPHSKEEKDKPLTEAPSGIVGLETSLALGITALVRGGKLSLMELIRKMSTNPAKIYGLNAGAIYEGGPADLVLFREEETFKVEDFASKSKNSPFLGETLYGKVCYTICNGKIIYQAE